MTRIEINDPNGLLSSATEWMRKRRWHKLLGKHRDYTQSLFHHVLVQLNLLVAIRSLLLDPAGFGLSDEQFLALFVGNLCHDLGKEDPAWQEAVLKGERPPDHVHYEETHKAIEEWSGFLIESKERTSFVATVSAAVGLHHKATQGPANVLDQHLNAGQTDSRWRELADLVEAVDKVCSAGTVVEAAAEADRRFGRGLPQRRFDVSFHRVQILRGVSTTFLHRAAQDTHDENGWTPVIHFADGTLYVALASADVNQPTGDQIQKKLAALFEQLLKSANLAEQVVGNPTGNMLPKPELFNAGEFESYLTVAGQRSKPVNFRRKYGRKRDGSFSEEFQGGATKSGMLQKYCELKGIAVPAGEEDRDRAFERFVSAIPLDCIFRFFKTVVLSDKLITAEQWPLNEIQQKEIEDAIAAVKGDKEEAREKKRTKAKKAALERWRATLKAEYEEAFGRGSFENLASVTNDPALNLAKAVDYFLNQSATVEDVQWLSKPSAEQQTELIHRLNNVFQSAVTKLPEGVLPLPLDGNRLASLFLGDLLLPALSPFSNVAKHLEAYLRAKDDTEETLFCPWSNETGLEVIGTGSDFGVATDGHSNRLPMQGKTWKDRGGVKMALGSRYELMLRRLLLGDKLKQLIVLIPPVQLGAFDGRRLVDTVAELEEAFTLHSREFSPNPTLRFSFNLTDQIARNLRAGEGTPLISLLSYASRKEEEHKTNLSRGLEEYFGPSDGENEIAGFNRRHAKDFTTWAEARKDKQLKEEAETEFLRLALSSLNEICSTSFRTWEESIESIYRGGSQEAKKALDTSDEVRERRRLALEFRESSRFVCQTPNLIFVLLPDAVAVGKDSIVNASIRQLFLSLIIARALGVSVALIDGDEALNFSAGQGAVRIPRNAALRSQVNRIRKTWAMIDKSAGVPSTHEWLLPHETELWLNALAVVHELAAERFDEKRNTLFPPSSALYDVISARSPGFLARRIENKAKRNIGRGELQMLGLLEPFLG